jgi:hypothetical protein
LYSLEIRNLNPSEPPSDAELNAFDSKQVLVLDRPAFDDPGLRGRLSRTRGRLCLKSDGDPNIFFRKIVHQHDSVIISLPNGRDAVKKYFGLTSDEILEPLLDQMHRVRETMAQGHNAIFFENDMPATSNYREQLLTEVQRRNGGVLVFIGHNENGDLKFPDGSSISITELSNRADQCHVTPIILSCQTIDGFNSGDTGIISTKSVQFEELADAMISANRAMVENGCMYLGDYLYFYNDAISRSTKANGRIQAVIQFVGKAIVVLFMNLFFDDAKMHK